jgi:hypothetical protein
LNQYKYLGRKQFFSRQKLSKYSLRLGAISVALFEYLSKIRISACSSCFHSLMILASQADHDLLNSLKASTCIGSLGSTGSEVCTCSRAACNCSKNVDVVVSISSLIAAGEVEPPLVSIIRVLMVLLSRDVGAA